MRLLKQIVFLPLAVLLLAFEIFFELGWIVFKFLLIKLSKWVMK